METSVYERVKQNPQFSQLVSKRSRLAWMLSAIMLGAYYLFILILAFFPNVLGVRLGDSVITMGIPVGIGIIFLAFILTGIYVFVANREFDKLSAQIKSKAEDVA